MGARDASTPSVYHFFVGTDFAWTREREIFFKRTKLSCGNQSGRREHDPRDQILEEACAVDLKRVQKSEKFFKHSAATQRFIPIATTKTENGNEFTSKVMPFPTGCSREMKN